MESEQDLAAQLRDVERAAAARGGPACPRAPRMIGDLDPVIHAPKRLAAMAMLASATCVSFPFLRAQLGIGDSDLSKQMAALERAGYVKISKTGRGRGATTSYRITRAGHSAYQRHAAALRRILAGTDSLTPGPPSPA